MKYNIIYDEYEAFLPDEGEIALTISKVIPNDCLILTTPVLVNEHIRVIAKAISSRLRGEQYKGGGGG